MKLPRRRRSARTTGRPGRLAVRLYYSKAVQWLLTTAWYSLFTRLDKDGEALFLNYGFAHPCDQKIPLRPEDETERYPIQLYDHVASAISLRDRDVLEVGCGRGGGAFYITRHLHPRKVVAVDNCAAQIAFARKRFDNQPNLVFLRADAHKLPFEDCSFDVVVSVEASHHFDRMEEFLHEVDRVLRPGGYFLMTCFRKKHLQPLLAKQLQASALTNLKEEDITDSVVYALDLDRQRRKYLVEKLSPWIIKRLAAEFAGVPGTDICRRFASGALIYKNYVFQKTPADQRVATHPDALSRRRRAVSLAREAS